MSVIHTFGNLRVVASPPILQAMQQDTCIEQGKSMLSLPGVIHPVWMMPDAHQGYGFPIGGVAAFDVKHGVISPGAVGFDINCGMRLLVTSLRYEDVKDRIASLIDALYERIPVGMGHDSWLRLSHEQLDEAVSEGINWAIAKGYATPADKTYCEALGRMECDVSCVSPTAKKRGRLQLGTLGAGNHFVEIQKVDEVFDAHSASVFGLSTNQICIMIHTGSRGYGHQICSEYISAFLEKYPVEQKDLAYAPLQSELGQRYYKAMCCAMNYAWLNRQLITYKIREVFGDAQLVYDMSHNNANIEVFDGKQVLVHRKGAARCYGPGAPGLPDKYIQTGQPVLIPGSMGTASYIMCGTQQAMELTFGSTCHGAGRVMSRAYARSHLNEQQVSDAMQGVVLKASGGVLDEAPQVYKDVDEVVRVCAEAGLGKLCVKLKPLGVIKG